jgi:hypothetical protein
MRVPRVVRTVDPAPTLLTWRLPAPPALDGTSLVPLVVDAPAKGWPIDNVSRSLVRSGAAVRLRSGPYLYVKAAALYDVAQDPGEGRHVGA